MEFAAEKLLDRPMTDALKLACLSVRLALDFNPFTAEALQNELEQIENHLRARIRVSDSFDRVKSVSPSNPSLEKPQERSCARTHTGSRSFDGVSSTRH